jgi:hypothetical protein
MHLLEVLHELWVFVGNVLLNERCGFEELLARFASELALVFLFDVGFDSLGQFPKRKKMVSMLQGMTMGRHVHALIIAFTTILARIDTFSVDQQGYFRIKPFQPALI